MCSCTPGGSDDIVVLLYACLLNITLHWKGYYYAELDFVLNLRSPTNATSSMKCQTMCYQDRDCKAFTYIQSTEKCYKHANKENEIEGKD